jgi:hypothetical protein
MTNEISSERRVEVGVGRIAAIRAVGVSVVGMKLDAQAGLKKGARHPIGREPQQAAGAREFDGDLGLGVGLDGFELSD